MSAPAPSFLFVLRDRAAAPPVVVAGVTIGLLLAGAAPAIDIALDNRIGAVTGDLPGLRLVAPGSGTLRRPDLPRAVTARVFGLGLSLLPVPA